MNEAEVMAAISMLKNTAHDPDTFAASQHERETAIAAVSTIPCGVTQRYNVLDWLCQSIPFGVEGATLFRSVAIACLKKFIPKAPREKQPSLIIMTKSGVSFSSIIGDCPICRNYVVEKLDQECGVCGQRLKWED